jgi:hypothetical protein
MRPAIRHQTCNGALTRSAAVYTVDPQGTSWKRCGVGFLAGLPIDRLL